MSVDAVDAILSLVCLRSTVYAREILNPLRYVEGADATIRDLEAVISRAGGDELLHSREFLNALLDLRLALEEENA